MDFIEKNKGVVIVCALLLFILAFMWSKKHSDYHERFRGSPGFPTGL